jgi:hypothetical protein
MNHYQWDDELRKWIERSRNIENHLAEAYVQFFTLAFKNTSYPERAWFGIHSSQTSSLVVGGIFLTAVLKSGKDKGIWLLMDQNPPQLQEWQYSPVKSTKTSETPLTWAHTGSFDQVLNILNKEDIWMSYAQATKKIFNSPRISSDRDEVQIRRGKKRLSDILSFVSPQAILEANNTPQAVDIADPETKRVKCVQYRILRDTALSRHVKALHNYKCQICGITLELGDGNCYAEAHHLRPLGAPHDGPDTLENIICVCPNHHALLDYGGIVLRKKDLLGLSLHTIGEEHINYHNTVIAEQRNAR